MIRHNHDLHALISRVWERAPLELPLTMPFTFNGEVFYIATEGGELLSLGRGADGRYRLGAGTVRLDGTLNWYSRRICPLARVNELLDDWLQNVCDLAGVCYTEPSA